MEPELDLPEGVAVTHAGWASEVAWSYLDRPTVWRLTGPHGEIRFAKVRRAGELPTLDDERERLVWSRQYLTVPEVVAHGTDGERDWLVTAPLPGRDSTVHPLRAEPSELVSILARALRALHDALPVAACPFDRRTPKVLEHVRERVAAGAVDPAIDFHKEFRHLDARQALAELERLAPADEDLVVGHGDYCLPNVLLDDNGSVTGYLDLGELGVADRRFDVVVGAWSVTWNLGPGWEQLFYDSYGLSPTPDDITFFRLLYDLES